MLRRLIGIGIFCWLLGIIAISAAISVGTFAPGIGSLTFQYNPASVWALDLRSGVALKLQDLPMLGTLSPDGHRILFAQQDEAESQLTSLTVEDRQTGQERHIGSYEDGAFLWAYASEYLLWISGNSEENTVYIQRISVETGDVLPLVSFFAPDVGFYAHGRLITFSPDRRFVSLRHFTSGSQPSQALVFDILSGEHVWEREAVRRVVWSADGRWLALQAADDVFEIVTMDESPALVGEFEGQAIGFAPNAAIFFFTQNSTLYRLDLADTTREPVQSAVKNMAGFTFDANSGIISPSGRYLLAMRVDTAHLLDTETGALFTPILGRAGSAVQLQWSPDERHILWIATSEARRILIYDVVNRRIVTDLTSRNPTNTFRLPTYLGWYVPE